MRFSDQLQYVSSSSVCVNFIRSLMYLSMSGEVYYWVGRPGSICSVSGYYRGGGMFPFEFQNEIFPPSPKPASFNNKNLRILF